MAEFKALSVLKKFLPKELYDGIEKEVAVQIEEELNKDITKYITANAPKADEVMEEARKTAHIEVIKALKIKDVETVEQLKSHIETVKLSSTDQASEVTRLTTALGEVTGKYENEVATRTKIEKETSLANQKAMIKALGIEDEKQVEFIHWDLSKEVSEEVPFEAVFEAYKSTLPEPQTKKHIDPRIKSLGIGSAGDENGYEIYKRQQGKK